MEQLSREPARGIFDKFRPSRSTAYRNKATQRKHLLMCTESFQNSFRNSACKQTPMLSLVGIWEVQSNLSQNLVRTNFTGYSLSISETIYWIPGAFFKKTAPL